MKKQGGEGRTVHPPVPETFSPALPYVPDPDVDLTERRALRQIPSVAYSFSDPLIRYPLTATLSYLLFFLFIKLWLWYVSTTGRQKVGDTADGLAETGDVVGVPDVIVGLHCGAGNGNATLDRLVEQLVRNQKKLPDPCFSGLNE